MQEKLMISLSTQQRAFHRGQIAESEFQQGSRNLGDGLLMLRRVTHNATFSNLPFAYFKLGFDQNDQVGERRKKRNERRQNQRDRDKGNVNGHEFRTRSDSIKGDEIGVKLLQDDHRSEEHTSELQSRQ